MDIKLRKGLLEVCVLAVLRRGDSYGYQLVRDVSPLIEITESTLYPILKRLEAAQLLTTYSVEHNSRLRKYYRITPGGEARIQDFLREWKEVTHIYRIISGEKEDNSHE